METAPQIGPQRIDGISVFTRLLFGVLGGIAGLLLLLLALAVAGSFLNNVFQEDSVFSGVASFAILTSLFLASTITNLLSVWLFTVTNQPKYTRITEGLMQSLIINIVLFLFTIGAFFLTETTNHMLTFAAITFHLVFTAMATVIMFEITATRWSYPLVTVYDALLGTFVAAVLLIALYAMFEAKPMQFFFGVPVVVWGSIGFVSGLTEYVYYQSYRRLGVDVLQTREVAAKDAPAEEQFPDLEDDKPF